MGSVVRGAPQRSRAGIDKPLTRHRPAHDSLANLLDQVGSAAGFATPPDERHAAAVTTAEYAIDNDWSLEDLAGVLDVLGLRGDE